MNSFEETVEFLYNQTPQFQQIGAAAYKPGLDSTRKLDDAFGNPHRNYRTIHVGGTNGKGSTAHTLAAILQKQGYRVGLYTSPHLVDFRERIRVNGTMIPREKVVEFVDRFRTLDIGHLSFFELATIMAFNHFAEEKVDFAVVEVGLGGRLDSTNIISPVLSVITNISKDHTAQLGNTLTTIASEKAGIIKRGVPVVIGEAEGEIKDVFIKKAALENAPIHFAPKLHGWFTDENGYMNYPKTYAGHIKSALAGDCQPLNASTILTTVEQLKKLGIVIDNHSIAEGFHDVVELTGLLGRWTKLNDRPTLICDTGHNTGGWQYLSKRLNSVKNRLHMVIGFVNDKDYNTILDMMPENATYYFTRAAIPRALSPEELADAAKQHHLSGNSYPSVKEAVAAAMDNADENDTIFVGGSTFIVADLMAGRN